ncbi:Thromboxane-A synthase [Rhizophlyctis rosea]|nr:Thromboxane-A synthase [Rhizophlyctis rosea]
MSSNTTHILSPFQTYLQPQILPSGTLLLLIPLSLLLHRKMTTPNTKLPTPEGSWPLVGSLPVLLPYLKTQRLVEFFAVHQRALNIPLYNAALLGRFTPILADPHEAKRLLTETDTFVRSDTLERTAMGVSKFALFLLPTGPTWKRHRKLVQPGFAPLHIRKTVPVAVRLADRLVGVWRDLLAADEDIVVDIQHHFKCLTLEVIGEVAIGGYEFNIVPTLGTPESVNHKTAELQAMEDLVDGMARRYGSPPMIWRLLGVTERDLRPHVEILKNVAREVIRTKRESAESAVVVPSSDETSTTTARPAKELDVLDRLLHPLSSGDTLTEEEIIDEALGFIMAGHETSSNAILNTTLFLCHNPDKRAKLVEEIARVLGKGGVPTWENLSELKYLDCVIKEVQRLANPIGLNPRTTIKDTTLCGHFIPKNTEVILNIHSLHRSPEHWGPTADHFIPERWTDDPLAKEAEAKGAYMPFGAGEMMCVGFRMALVEIKVIIIRLLQNFDLQLLPESEQKFKWSTHGVPSTYKGGVLVKLKDFRQ